MKYYNYKDLGIVSAKTPFSNHQFIETTYSARQLILVDSGAEDDVYSSSDKADNWTQVTGEHGDVSGNKLKRCLWHDRGNSVLYFLVDEAGGSITTLILWQYTTDIDGTLGSYAQGTDNQPIDVVKIGADIYTFCVTHAHAGSPNDERVRIGGKIVHSNTLLDTNMGAFAGRTSDYSYTVVVGTDIYLLWRWSDENVELWKYDTVANTFVEINDLGANTVIPDRNRKGIAYDGTDVLYFIIQDSGDSKYYLWTYAIASDTATKHGEYNISLMLNRNTASGILEKAIHLTEYKVYQLQKNKIQLYLIAVPTSDAAFIGITDNFLMNNDGDMFEFEDQMSLISSALLDHEVEEASKGIVTQLKGSIPITKNMIMQFYYNYTTATATSEKIVFEGLITNFTEDVLQTITLVGPAKKEIKTILPSGNYTKDTDGLISQLIIDYNNYVTQGTLADGGDLGTISLGGVLTEETIFDGCAKFDGFLWYFNPTGQLFYNNGTIDSGVNYTQASVLSGVNISHVHEEYNKIKVRGAYIDGVQVESVWQEDLASQQALGINERIFLISFLNTVALCNTAASNILTILAKDPLRVKFTVKDTTKGYVQVGETITFEYATSGKTVSSDQFIITSATINKYGDVRYTIVSELS